MKNKLCAAIHEEDSLHLHGLARLLAELPGLKGVGPATAKKIVEACGQDFDQLLRGSPEKIASAAGLSLETARSLKREWVKVRAQAVPLSQLMAMGITYGEARKLLRYQGPDVLKLLKTDPYLLIGKIPGFAFKTVDGIARKAGISKDNRGRIRACLLYHVANVATREGNCWIPHKDLIDEADRDLIMDALNSRVLIEEEIKKLIKEGLLVTIPHMDMPVASLDSLNKERELGLVFLRGWQVNPHTIEAGCASSIILTPDQAQAVANAAQYSITLMAGGAGTGKTTAIKAIVENYLRSQLTVALAAPTGKAARRLEEVVGCRAQTIHRLLGFNGFEWKRGHHSPVDADVIVVDEVSMMDVPLAWRLFQAIDLDRTAVVLVGDHNQLPPVGPGNILRDLLETKAVPTVVLSQVIRQAGELKENSIAVLGGEVRKTSDGTPGSRRPWYCVDTLEGPLQVMDSLLKLFEEKLTESLGFDLLHDVQVLTPTHKGPLGTESLNKALQRSIQRKLWGIDVLPVLEGKKPNLLLNDRVIQTRNNYKLGVMNGEIGIVTGAHTDGSIAVDFDKKTITIAPSSQEMRDLELAYALTVHKTQGSEYSCVIAIVHKAHSYMHQRNLIYTAVTRAQETVIILGDQRGVKSCAKKVVVDRRKTFLSLLPEDLKDRAIILDSWRQ